MNIRLDIQGDSRVCVIEASEVLISDAQSALDLLATLFYEYQAAKAVLPKACIAEAFFQLRTGLAGEIAQKITNYHMALALVGDFEQYTSKPLQDWMGECNRGKQLFFLPQEAAALEKLHSL